VNLLARQNARRTQLCSAIQNSFFLYAVSNNISMHHLLSVVETWFFVSLCKSEKSKCKSKGKDHPCTGTEALYRPYGREGE